MMESKSERAELEVLRQDIASKAHKNELDVLNVKLSNMKIDYDQKVGNTEKDIDEFVETVQNELNTIRNSMMQSLNKKADFSMLDRLNEIVSKKVDVDHLRQTQC